MKLILYWVTLIKEFNITLNGNSVNGYPLIIKNECPVLPLHKFFDSTNRLQNIYTGENITQKDFKNNWIWSHKFECENASQGWLGINLKLEEAFETPMSLVVWLINPTALSVDKFHQIEKINLWFYIFVYLICWHIKYRWKA